jgi:hypothetical protein
MAIRIKPTSAAGQFLLSQGVTEDVLNAATFRMLNWQAGAAITVMLPFGIAAIFVKSKYLQPDANGDLPVNRRLPLIRHELFHVQQGKDWGFFGYWVKQLWSRVRYMSITAPNSPVEKPAYDAQAAAHATMDQLGIPW